MTPAQFCDEVRKLFRSNGNKKYAIQMAAYMRNHFDFFGIKAPHRKELQKVFLKKRGLPTYDNLSAIVRGLWKAPERELQYFAMELIDKMKKQLEKEYQQQIEFIITEKSWWDTVDFIAAHISGDFFKKFPDLLSEITRHWSNSGNLWLNRSAILVQLKYKEQTNNEMLSTYILKHRKSKEFFHQKAIGWALREYAKTNPEWVVKFVESNELAPLSKREALKNIN